MNNLTTDIQFVFGKDSGSGKLQTDTTVSISKGICIILMVIGHSECPTFLHDFIYLFHMPFFFFISGWFCKQSTTLWGKEGLSVKILKRIKRLYIPFVLYCLAFFCLSAISNTLTGIDYFGVGNITFSKVLKVFINMEAPTDLLGATWFIRSLFFAAVIIDISLYAWRNINNGKLWLFAQFFLIAIFMKSFPPGTPVIRQLALIFYGGSFFMLGCCCKELFKKLTDSVWTLPLSVILLVIGTILAPSSMLKVNGIWNSILYFFEAIPGILMILILSSFINKLIVLKKGLSYVGNNTRVILFLHFTAFLAINLLAVNRMDLDRSFIASFPVIHSLKNGWWILYSIAGISLPLLLKYCSAKLRPNK